jgi:hypothetical protein
MTFKLRLHFIQLKNISNTHGFSFFANKLFEILSTFKGKVLKRYQLHEYHFFHELYSIILCTCSSNLIYTKKVLSMKEIC